MCGVFQWCSCWCLVFIGNIVFVEVEGGLPGYEMERSVYPKPKPQPITQLIPDTIWPEKSPGDGRGRMMEVSHRRIEVKQVHCTSPWTKTKKILPAVYVKTLPLLWLRRNVLTHHSLPTRQGRRGPSCPGRQHVGVECWGASLNVEQQLPLKAFK